MKRTRHTVERIQPAVSLGFDQQFWPVLLAIIVLCGLTAGIISTLLRGPWMWGGLMILPAAAAMIIFLVYRLDDSLLRRSLQLAVAASLAIHLVLLVVTTWTNIFGNSIPDNIVVAASQPQRKIIVTNSVRQLITQRAQAHQLPEVLVETQREQTRTNVKSETMPVVEQDVSVDKPFSERRQELTTLPRRDSQVSQRSRSERSVRSNIARAELVSQNAAVHGNLTASSAETSITRRQTAAEYNRQVNQSPAVFNPDHQPPAASAKRSDDFQSTIIVKAMPPSDSISRSPTVRSPTITNSLARGAKPALSPQPRPQPIPLETSVTRAEDGFIGTSRSHNLDRVHGGPASPVKRASDASHKHSSSRVLENVSLSALQKSPTLQRERSSEPGQIVRTERIPWSQRPAASLPVPMTAQSSASDIDSSKSDVRREFTAEKGASMLDIGPTKFVPETLTEYRGGGGRMELNPTPHVSNAPSGGKKLQKTPVVAAVDMDHTAHSVFAADSAKGDRENPTSLSLETRTVSTPHSQIFTQRVTGENGTKSMVDGRSNTRSDANNSTEGTNTAVYSAKRHREIAAVNGEQRVAESARKIHSTAKPELDHQAAVEFAVGSTPGPGPQLVEADSGDLSRRETTTTSVASALQVELNANEGPGGFSSLFSARVGRAIEAIEQSTSLAWESPNRFWRREDGGLPTVSAPAILAKEAFRSRHPAALVESGPQTEAAIELGLDFLSRHQLADGSWTLRQFDTSDPLYQNQLHSDTAATGLALLAFQGAGYNHREYKYAVQVRRGIEWLLANQSDDGGLYLESDQASNQACRLYSHAIAALALTESYGMTQDPALKLPTQRALDYISDTQHISKGGWRYFVEPQKRASDTSVTGWMLMALKSGELAGLHIQASTLEKVEGWLRVAEDPESESEFRYNPYAVDSAGVRREHGRTATPSMTSVGLLMRIYSGWGAQDPRLLKGADSLMRQMPSDENSRSRDTYYWYYATQVMKHAGGTYWEKWSQELHPLLLNTQEKTGPMRGSWHPYRPAPDRWAPQGGRLYVTTMNLLSLEVRYRLLPLYEKTIQ